MAYVSLLGDSIIDNKVYVQPHELSVKEHLEEQSGYMFKQLAVDGHTTSDVLSFQLDKLPKLSTHKVLSIGGNDLLGQIYFCLLYTSPSPRDKRQSRMPSSA